MGIFLGVDVGTVSLKVVVLGDEASNEVLSNSVQRSDLLRRPAQSELSDPKLSKHLLVAEYIKPVKNLSKLPPLLFLFFEREVKLLPFDEAFLQHPSTKLHPGTCQYSVLFAVQHIPKP